MKYLYPGLLLFILFSLISSGCSSGFIHCSNKSATLCCVRKEFTKSFKNETSNADSLIHFDGYYYNSNYNVNGNYIVFYKNGLVGYRCEVDHLKDSSRSQERFHYCSLWGTYSVSSDTLKMRYASKGALMRAYEAFELWFLIKDKEHLETLVDRNICYPPNSDTTTRKFTAVYVPSEKLPKYEDCWLLKEKWFWKDENEWNRFIDSTKKNDF